MGTLSNSPDWRKEQTHTRYKIGLQGVKFSILSDCHNMFEQEMGEDFHTAAYKDGQRMEGLKRQHRRAMDPEVNPLDGALLPLSPGLAYIQQKILPRILRNPFARCFPFVFHSFFLHF